VETILPRPEGTEEWIVVGLEKTEVLDFQPSSIFKHVTIRERLVNPADEDAGVTDRDFSSYGYQFVEVRVSS